MERKEQNIAVLFLSDLKPVAEDTEFVSKDGKFKTVSLQTNETGLKYLEWKLHNEGRKLAKVFAIVTSKAKETAWERFCSQFKDREFAIVPIATDDNLDMDQSFQVVNEIFDAIQVNGEGRIRVHADFTGGFRHSAMLLLALLQMLSFAGMEIGYVTYVNFFSEPKLVEEANELLRLFILTNGTTEFKSFGMSKGLQKYFDGREISPSLRSLLNAMDLFSERIKVCSNIEDMQKAGKELGDAIESYESLKFIAPQDSLSPQEVFFNKLIPSIKKDYQTVLESVDDHKYAMQLILWCLDKGLLQQAVTLYSQWMPVFMFRSGLISEPSEEIIEQCRKLGDLWKSWEIAFFRSYLPAINFGDRDGKAFTIKDFRDCLVNGLGLKDILKAVPNNAIKLRTVLNDISKAVEIYDTIDGFYNYVIKLPQSNLLKKILVSSCPSTSNFTNYLRTRLRNTKSNEEMVLKAMQATSNDFFAVNFDMQQPTGQDLETQNRSEVFVALLKKNVITTKLSEEILYKIVDDFNDVIINTRNTFSHADAQRPADLEEVMREDINSLLQFC